MASSSDLSTIETWAFRPAFENSWISDAFARDTDALTKALHKSISDTDVSLSAATFSDLLKPETPSSLHQGQSVSSSGGSEPETVSKRVPRNPNPSPPSGKIAKRKPRVSKRSPTTFITADPSNFRQMVQQVTGIRFAGGQMPTGSVLKPEPHRPVGVVNRLQAGGYLLPTLDTSAFLLDHHHQQPAGGGGQSSLGFGTPSVVADGGHDFDGFSLSSFPTLDSWKVM